MIDENFKHYESYIFIGGQNRYKFLPGKPLKLIRATSNRDLDNFSAFGEFEGLEKDNIRENYKKKLESDFKELYDRMADENYLNKVYEVSKIYQEKLEVLHTFRRRNPRNPAVIDFERFCEDNRQYIEDARYDIKSTRLVINDYSALKTEKKFKTTFYDRREDATYDDRIYFLKKSIKSWIEMYLFDFDDSLNGNIAEYNDIIECAKELLNENECIYVAYGPSQDYARKVIDYKIDKFTLNDFFTFPRNKVLRLIK